MTPSLRASLWLIRRACSDEGREEIEGDLLELYALRSKRRGRLSAGLGCGWEALRIVLARPSGARSQLGLKRALLLTGAALGIAYLVLIADGGEPRGQDWPLVAVGTALELLWWSLLLAVRKGAGRVG